MGKKRRKDGGQSTTPPPVDVAVQAPGVTAPKPVAPAIAEGAPEDAVVQVQASAIADVVVPSERPPVAAAPPVVEDKPPVVEEKPPVIDAAPTPIAAPVIEEMPESELEPESEVGPESEVATSEPPPSVVVEGVPAAPKKKRRKKRVAKKAKPSLDQKIDHLEQKLEAKKEEAKKAAAEGFGKTADEDTSVPPVDLEVHDDFFAAGERGPITRDASGSFSALDQRHLQKASAAARARRAHLAKYVKWAVAGSIGILALAFTVNKLRTHPAGDPLRHEVVHAALPTPEQQKAAAQPTVQEIPEIIEVADQGNTNDKGAQPGTDDKTDDKKDEAKDESKKPDEMPAEKPKNAWQEKQAAKAALERGSNGVAVQAGERSVALDPSDGEAWLVLGGAYQAMGNNAQAKRCYNACISQGSKGPIGDCRDMLKSF